MRAPTLRNIAPRRQRTEPDRLNFAPLTSAEIPVLSPLLRTAPTRACDFTVGGLFLWADWFRYSYAIEEKTLFIKGFSESDMATTAYSLPVGALPLEAAISRLRRHCASIGEALLLSAVPEDALPAVEALRPVDIQELPDWADYIYDIAALSTFAGKKLNKKRNHINRFISENPDYALKPIDSTNLPAVREFLSGLEVPVTKPLMADYDRLQVFNILDNPDIYPFYGAVLTIGQGQPVAFTFGEVKGDTLVTHVEKIDHSVTGAGETICRDFCAMMSQKFPGLRFVNREDDAGDPGLRQAKQAMNPSGLIRKYNVLF